MLSALCKIETSKFQWRTSHVIRLCKIGANLPGLVNASLAFKFEDSQLVFKRRCVRYPSANSSSTLTAVSYFKGSAFSGRAASMVGCKSARGAFIVFEGVDRSGKSTQCQNLVKNLTDAGVIAERWSFPDRTTPTGQMIDAYLRSQSDLDDASVHLLFSANRWEKKSELLSKLESGVTLVVDRYAFSGAVFTAAKGIPGLDLEWSKAPDRGLPAPDAVLYLNLTVEAAAKRGCFGDERYEKEELQQKVRKLYSSLAKEVRGWTQVDAAQSVDDLNRQVFDLAMKEVKLRAEKGGELAALWKQ